MHLYLMLVIWYEASNIVTEKFFKQEGTTGLIVLAENFRLSIENTEHQSLIHFVVK